MFGMNQFPAAPGSNGGLGGLGGNPMLQAIGMSLLSSPRNAPLSGFGDAYMQMQGLREKRSALQRQTEQEAQQRAAFEQALISAGMDPARAKALSVNPTAAKFAMEQQESSKTKNTTRDWLLGQGMSEADADAAVSNPEILSQVMKGMSGSEMTDTQKNLMWRAQQAGLQPGTPEYTNFMASGGSDKSTNITVNTGEGDKFYENLDKKNAETFSALSEAGVQGRPKLAQIDRLEGLLANAPQGAAAMLKQAAGEYGIATDGLSDIQAAQALINELVPQQRQPGSGPMSDADLALFKQSLPRLINQPGGNQTIIETMRGITQYQIQMGNIADMVADREITPAEGRKMIRELPNPLDDFGKKIAKTQSAGGKGAPAGVEPEVWDAMTPEEKALFQ